MNEIGLDGWVVLSILILAIVLLAGCAWDGWRERRRRDEWAGVENEDRLA